MKISSNLIKAFLLLFLLSNSLAAQGKKPKDWTRFVRTAGHGVAVNSVDSVLLDARTTNLYGIEVDNDPPGRYESFLDPKEKLDALKLMAKKAHETGNYVFAYIAGTECITAHADNSPHTLFKDHPDWVQRDINDRPAVFGGGVAFWVGKGDEDVWISPYAPEWRKRYMELVRQITATGIDGIYVDIPYWMTHFDGWEDTWASFDKYTVEAFRQKTGLDAKKDLKLGDFSDANFRRWVDFRIETLTDFMKEVNDNVKAVNPKAIAVAEIYPGINRDAVRVGTDVYEMYPVLDAITHEFSGGGGNAASKQPADWFSYMVGMYSFRAFAEGKPSWMLSYSWEKQPQIDPKEAMKNLFISQVIAGTNSWDAQGHVMSGSNDKATRKQVYDWIARNENHLYEPRVPIAPVGLYFSPKTRDYFTDSFMSSYGGFFNLLLQSHTESQVVTPRTLSHFTGKVLILPDADCLADSEIYLLQTFTKNGGRLLLAGAVGKYDETGAPRTKSFAESLTGESLTAIHEPLVHAQEWMYYPVSLGKSYTEEMKKNFNEAAWNGELQGTSFNQQLQQFQTVLKNLTYHPSVTVTASPFSATQIAMVNGEPHLYLANFKGLKGKENAIQKPEVGVQVSLADSKIKKAWFLEYLAEAKPLAIHNINGQSSVTLPDIQKGAVVWFEH